MKFVDDTLESRRKYWEEIHDKYSSLSNDEILDAIEALRGLPDEWAPWFGRPNFEWDDEQTLHNAAMFVELAHQIAERHLRPGVPLLLERASYGDYGEMMRFLPNKFKAAFKPDWKDLAEICVKYAKHSRT